MYRLEFARQFSDRMNKYVIVLGGVGVELTSRNDHALRALSTERQQRQRQPEFGTSGVGGIEANDVGPSDVDKKPGMGFARNG